MLKVWFFIVLGILYSVQGDCVTQQEWLIREIIPQHVTEVFNVVVDSNLSDEYLIGLIKILGLRGQVINDFIIHAMLWADDSSCRSAEQTMLPSKKLVSMAQEAFLFHKDLNESLKTLVAKIEAAGEEVFVFSHTIRYSLIENFLLSNPTDQLGGIEQGFYFLSHQTFLFGGYDAQEKYADSLFYALFLIQLYRKLIGHLFLRKGCHEDSFRGVKIYLLPIYQVTFYSNMQEEEKRKLFNLFYAIRLSSIVLKIYALSLFFEDKDIRVQYPFLHRIDIYKKILQPVASIEYAEVFNHFDFICDHEMRDTLATLFCNDFGDSSSWVDLHMQRLAHMLGERLNTEFLVWTWNDIATKVFENHEWVVRLCKFVVAEFEKFGISIDQEANALAEQLLEECALDAQKKKKYSKTRAITFSSLASIKPAKKLTQLCKVIAEKSNFSSVRKNNLGEIITHFPDNDLEIPQGNLDEDVLGVLEQHDDYVIFYDNNRLNFGGNKTIIALFGNQKNDNVSRLLRSMRYDYLREQNRKIAINSDNNHAFTEWVEKGFGHLGRIVDERPLTEQEKAAVKHYGKNYERRLLITIPMRLVGAHLPWESEQFFRDGPWGDAEYILYCGADESENPLCVHRFYRVKKNKRRKMTRHYRQEQPPAQQ